jgi:hypothetical protein
MIVKGLYIIPMKYKGIIMQIGKIKRIKNTNNTAEKIRELVQKILYYLIIVLKMKSMLLMQKIKDC